ncbi:MAG: LacI family DNA-binding transcriptional regulator [Syntrophorhabdales bacterium]|jgi:LacI family transcriptional regulator
MKNTSIVDVAKLAGVSITTVSRIINNVSYPVSDEKRKRVLKAIEKLHYRPNIAAQHLKKRFSDIIGLIVRDISDPYFGDIAKGVTERASQLGYLSLVCSTGRNPEDELRYHDILWQHRVKGIILAGGGLDQFDYKQNLSKQLARHDKYGLKIVALAPQGMEIPYVMIDNYEAGKRITEYLIQRGHRNICFISGPQKVYTSIERLKGYKDAIDCAGIEFSMEHISYSDFTRKGGYDACKVLLSKVKNMTAICGANDNIVIGAMSAVKEQGLNIPEDISFISIGDLTEAMYADPPLTTLSIPRYEIGMLAVDAIVEDKDSIAVIVDTKIIERRSVKTLN